MTRLSLVVFPRFPDFLARFHPHIRARARTFLLTCPLTCSSALSYTPNCRRNFSVAIVTLNDLAIVVSLLWHANHPRSSLRRAMGRTTQIANFILFSRRADDSAARLSRPFGRKKKPDWLFAVARERKSTSGVRKWSANWEIIRSNPLARGSFPSAESRVQIRVCKSRSSR